MASVRRRSLTNRRGKNCDDQDEIDRYWNALLYGGSAEQRGWLKDRLPGLRESNHNAKEF